MKGRPNPQKPSPSQQLQLWSHGLGRVRPPPEKDREIYGELINNDKFAYKIVFFLTSVLELYVGVGVRASFTITTIDNKYFFAELQ